MRFSRLLSAAILASSLALATGCAAEPPPVSEKVQQYYDASRTLKPSPTEAAAPKINITPGMETMIFGDSWTLGTGAKPNTLGYAYQTVDQLHLVGDIQGGGGTGYLNPGPSGNQTFRQRLAALPPSNPGLIIIQGSVNDQNQDQMTLGQEADGLIADVRAKYPAAQIVILGPAPSSIPVNIGVTRADDILQNRARIAGLNYISPVQSNWITAENETTVIDQTNEHPSTEGHAHLASKLVEALNAIKAP